MYAVTKIGQKSTQAAYIIRQRFARENVTLRLARTRHKRRCEKMTTRRYAIVKINEEIDFSSLLNLFRVKAVLNPRQ